MTDGVSDPFLGDDIDNLELWKKLREKTLHHLEASDLEEGSKELCSWLNFKVKGAHDDKTIVLCALKDTFPKTQFTESENPTHSVDSNININIETSPHQRDEADESSTTTVGAAEPNPELEQQALGIEAESEDGDSSEDTAAQESVPTENSSTELKLEQNGVVSEQTSESSEALDLEPQNEPEIDEDNTSQKSTASNSERGAISEESDTSTNIDE